MKNIKHAVKKGIKIFSAVILIILIILSVLLLHRQIIRTNIYHNNKITTKDGIDEEVEVKIGGVNQYLYIRGKDLRNPVILVLHGGPGSPLTYSLNTYQYLWEKDYTVVNWDQRNTGKTYFLNKDSKTEVTKSLSINRSVEDVHEIALYLQKKLGCKKIIILGHSWGTVIGSQFALRYPELTSGYIGVGQVVNSNKGVSLAYKETVNAAANSGNKKDIDILMSINNYLPGTENFDMKQFNTLQMLTTKYLNPNHKDTTLKDLWFSPYYSLKDDSYFFFTNIYQLQEPLFKELAATDLMKQDINYKVPVLFISGENDWRTPVSLIKDYFQIIKSPHKDILYVSGAGHNCFQEKPEKFFKLLSKALGSSNN